MILESGLAHDARESGFKGKPNPYDPVLNRINLMKNRDSIYDNEIIELIAILIASNDLKITEDTQGISMRKDGFYRYERTINKERVKYISSKDYSTVKKKRKEYISKILK